MSPYTHTIVSMTAGRTKGSQSPLWRCLTADGERVNVFKHTDMTRDTFRRFEQAGYGELMLSLSDGEALGWRGAPIQVTLERDGQWWQVVAVAPRPAEAAPDARYVPDLALYRRKATTWARCLLESHLPVVIWDTETTSLAEEGEVCAVAVINLRGQTLLNTLLRPQQPERLYLPHGGQSAHDVTGLTPDLLADAPPFEQIYPVLYPLLHNRLWLLYNAPFDTARLERECLRRGLLPPTALGTHCVMELFSQFHGEWDARYQHFTSKKLSFAAQRFGLDTSSAHSALADCLYTSAVVAAIASQEQVRRADHA